jgi:hypothetical protein
MAVPQDLMRRAWRGTDSDSATSLGNTNLGVIDGELVWLQLAATQPWLAKGQG